MTHKAGDMVNGEIRVFGTVGETIILVVMVALLIALPCAIAISI